MTPIAYFKLQAKNLFRDYKTKFIKDEKVLEGRAFSNHDLYGYKPKYFNIELIRTKFDMDEDNFSLMKAQHIIARMVGFNKWADMIKASGPELELAKLLFENQDYISFDDWEVYIASAAYKNKTYFEPEAQLEILKRAFAVQEQYDKKQSLDNDDFKRLEEIMHEHYVPFGSSYFFHEQPENSRFSTEESLRDINLFTAPTLKRDILAEASKFANPSLKA
ncbi:MAG: hypothetical protein FWG17_06310 [Desulfovibrionaceae bacterium]|nr:hypothetical protein [Desulfovibrionaceae bacterium]